MTLIIAESFDLVDNATDLQLKGWLVDQGSNVQGSCSIVSGAGRHSSQGLKILVSSSAILDYSFPSTIQQVIPSNEHATFSAGFALNWISGSGFQFFRLMSDATATVHLILALTSTGQLQLFTGPGLPLIGASNFFIRPNVWNYIEVNAPLGTSETVTVNVNDNEVIYLTGINTKNGGTKTTYDSFGFFTNNLHSEFNIDDVYITNGAGSVNTGMLGDLAVIAISPNGNGDESQLINDNGNSTNNYSYVNSATTQTATYVQSATAGNEDTYTMAALPYTTGVVLGVQTVMLTNKNNTGARTFAPVIRESGTDHVGTPVYLGTGVTYQQQIFEEDPGTSAQWTISGVNSAQFGAKVG